MSAARPSVHDRLRKACNLSTAGTGSKHANLPANVAKEVQAKSDAVTAQGQKLVYDVNFANNSAMCRGSGVNQGKKGHFHVTLFAPFSKTVSNLVLLLSIPSGIAVGPRATSTDSFGLISSILIDNTMLQHHRLVEAIVVGGKAVMKNIECMIYLDAPDIDGEEGGSRGYRTALSVKEDGSISLQGLWCPALDVSFQGKLSRNETDYRSNLPQDQWRNTRSWVGLGQGLAEFLEFAQAVAFLLPGSVGGNETIFQMSYDLYQNMFDDAKKESNDNMDKAEEIFVEYVDCLAKDTKPFKRGGETFLDSFIGDFVTKGTISQKGASIAKSSIARSAAVYRNAFDLNGMVHDEAEFKRQVKIYLKVRTDLAARYIGAAESDEDEDDDDAALLAAAARIDEEEAASQDQEPPSIDAAAERADQERTGGDETASRAGYMNVIDIQDTQEMPIDFLVGDSQGDGNGDDGEITIVIDANDKATSGTGAKGKALQAKQHQQKNQSLLKRNSITPKAAINPTKRGKQ